MNHVSLYMGEDAMDILGGSSQECNMEMQDC